MNRDLQVRPATRDDRSDVLRIVRAAFSTGGRDGQEEVQIVEAVWTLEATDENLELAAAIDGSLVGYVLGSWGHLGETPVVGVAPLAVAPSNQRVGVGGALMRELIRRADHSGLPALVLLGDPVYYQRFGFEPAGPLGICYRPVGPDSPHFQLRRLAAFTDTLQGEYTYSWESRGHEGRNPQSGYSSLR